LVERLVRNEKVRGSTPLGSTSSKFSIAGTSLVKVAVFLSLTSELAIFTSKAVWSKIAILRPVFSKFSEGGSEGKAGMSFSSSPTDGFISL
jgi:hypothetical protein